MKMATFSIVTPSYNQGRFIEETILSVLSQEGDFEVDYVIVDGGSTDNTLDIISKYEDLVRQDRYLIRCKGITLRWLSEKDRGQYHALNKGFRMTNGEIMAWINSDDKYTPWAFKTALDVFQRFPSVEWITGTSTSWNSKGMMVGVNRETFFTKRLMLNGFYPVTNDTFIQQESTFWRRSLWEKSGGKIDEAFALAGDFKLWADFMKHGRLYQVHAVLGGFRTHFDQKTALRKKEYRGEVKRIIGETDQVFSPGDDRSYHIRYSHLKEDWVLREIRIGEKDALSRRENMQKVQIGPLLHRIFKWRALLLRKLGKKWSPTG
jgi:glycosyltransferase involved in cell wall biosynthesis